MNELFGAFGSGGVCLAIAVWIIIGQKGKGKLAEKHETEHIAYWAILFGLIGAGAGQLFSAPATIGAAITHAVTTQSASFGNVGTGAVALILTVVLFGTKPRPILDSVLGSAVPSIYAAAGGLWALPLTVIAALVKSLFGAS